jgi:hypothetical protein
MGSSGSNDMNEMVERAWHAMCVWENGFTEEEIAHSIANPETDTLCMPFAAFRAAIFSMREPTEAMVSAAEEKAEEVFGNRHERLDYERAWKVMIDEMLK